MIGILMVLLALFISVGVTEEERADVIGQWKHVLEEVDATNWRKNIRANVIYYM